MFYHSNTHSIFANRLYKQLFVSVLDFFIILISIYISFYLRTGEIYTLNQVLSMPYIFTTIIALMLLVPIFIFNGLYRTIFRYSGISTIVSLTKSIFMFGLLYSFIFTFIGFVNIPKTIGIIVPLVIFLLISISRLVIKFIFEITYKNHIDKIRTPRALIYGAGSAGRQVAAAIESSNELEIVGFLDDDKQLHSHILMGLEIFNPQNLKEILKKYKITVVLIAIPSAPLKRRNQIANSLIKYKLAIRTLPGIDEIASGKINFNIIRDLDILELLGREPVTPNYQLLDLNIYNKVVLVTGAGGSIGSELCKQALLSRPKTLVIVDISEYALYLIHAEVINFINENFQFETVQTKIVPILASVCDELRINEIMNEWLPHTVYHSAAYKHVPIVEQNPKEGIRNNVLGTLVCAQAAIKNDVENFVFISTDKAVRPTNIMGASKRLSEIVLQSLNDQVKNNKFKTHKELKISFSIVRFGNVLGSSGSVVPLFHKQIAKGGPVTLTHPDVTRYFMTIKEAAELVIQAGAISSIDGDIFILDMGQPIKILDLAKKVVELHGLTYRYEDSITGDIEIKIIGLRPGEKLYEELLTCDNSINTIHPRIFVAQDEFIQWDYLKQSLDTLFLSLSTSNINKIRQLLCELVVDYKPTENNLDLL